MMSRLSIVIVSMAACLVWVVPGHGQASVSMHRAPLSPGSQAAGAAFHLRQTPIHVPLYFEANRGQTDRRVQFLARGQGLGIFLTRGGATLALYSGRLTRRFGIHTHLPANRVPSFTRKGVIGLTFLGTARRARPTGLHRLLGTVNYFVGRDPRRWTKDAPTYEAVQYRDLYPGANLVVHGNRIDFEYDWDVRPGADVRKILIGVSSSSPLRVLPNGSLLLDSAGGELTQELPYSYQIIDGKRISIPTRYTLLGAHEFGFRLGGYNRSRPVIIDPIVRYATMLGGLTDAEGIAADHNGNTYITGGTYSATFPGHGIAQSTVHTGGDTFIAKVNPAGTALVYATYLGGTSARRQLPNLPQSILQCSPGSSYCYEDSKDDQAHGIAIDSQGNAYVTGQTRSEDFPVVRAAQPNFGQGLCIVGRVAPQSFVGYCHDAYVTKLNPSGDGLVYSTYVGGVNEDVGQGIAVDAAGNAVIVGQTRSPQFPVQQPLQSQLSGMGCLGDAFEGNGMAPNPSAPEPCADAFVTKLSSDGVIRFSTLLGGENEDEATAVAVDRIGNIYVAGSTSSVDFPTTNGLPNTHADVAGAAFVAKLNPDGSRLIYSTYFGGTQSSEETDTDTPGPALREETPATTSNDTPGPTPTEVVVPMGGTEGTGIAVDAAGDAFLIGNTASTSLPVVSAVQSTLKGSNVDAFVAELAPSGTSLIFSTYLGGSSIDLADGIAVADVGEAYVTGTTESTDFPVVQSLQGPPQPTEACRDPLTEDLTGICSDIFVTRLDYRSHQVVYSTYLGGESIDEARAIALDGAGNAYVAGATFSPSIRGSAFLPDQAATEGSDSAFVLKVYDTPPPTPTSTPIPTSTPVPAPTKSAKRTAPACKKGYKRVHGKCTKARKKKP